MALRLGVVVAALCCIAATARADDPRWQWHFDGGAQIDPASHGVGNVGARRGALSLELYTDTLEARWQPESSTGKWWIAARAEAVFAGLMITPWTSGAVDRARSLYASYVGADAGWMHYFAGGLYGGVHGAAREYFFAATSDTRIAVPGATFVGTGELVGGRWSPSLHVWARAGLDVEPARASPHVAVEGSFHPAATLAPLVEVRAAWAADQDFLLKTRVGGVNPYVVPVAGAGWGEWWVESYAAGRLGLMYNCTIVHAGAAVDAAAFDGNIVTGFALLAGARKGRWFLDGIVGWAPWIERQPGVARFDGWIDAGMSY